MESFYSIQGEGTHSGKPSYFIRLAGCDVNCDWCDVKESWDIDNSQYNLLMKFRSNKKYFFRHCYHYRRRTFNA